MNLKLNAFFFLFLTAFLISFSGARPLPTGEELSQEDPVPGLFGDDEILDLTLSGDTRALFRDRKEDASYRPMNLSYLDDAGQRIEIPLKVKTRGHFRLLRSNCFYPPLRLNFAKKKTPENSLFAGQDKLKLVTPCRDHKYVAREYLVYKLYNLVNEHSFRARLARIVYEDTRRGRTTEPLYGIILEDEDQMAERNGGEIIKRDGVRPNKTDREAFLKMAVFEYLIGNTDWSIQFRQNIKLLGDRSTGRLIPVPYDFDHAGIVHTPYARPAPELRLRSIRERRYRGYCLEDLSVLDPVFAFYNELREDIYRVYTECDLLEEEYVEETKDFLDEFFATINDPEAMSEDFGYPCDPTGTGNVVIRGLREN